MRRASLRKRVFCLSSAQRNAATCLRQTDQQ
jgi:hypothetical protein